MKPIGKLFEEIVDDIARKMIEDAKAKASAEDAKLHAALRFGSPQMMQGNGKFDNARYMPFDDDGGTEF